MTDERSGTEVRVSVTVEAPIERAFEVFAERGDDWWPRSYGLGEWERSDLILEPREGGRWYERASDGRECDWGRVLEWDPPHHLVLSWQIGVGFVPEPNPQRASRVDITFVAEGSDRTKVTLVHSKLERHGEGWESMRDSVGGEGGWPGLLDAYAELLVN
ncbi:MAG: ATPase [Gemmatimonadetes bacterium]|uniref:ATPase n=1 Tax=Candidatus Kutchimonas denitrificans TaxID=3056748 RepID=A0AAE4Z786_9BACT|nr:ATPase [Gemmatimonadota bacterium]NIR74293.1 ATPase [Candidatus Kutchimonas denitrificans]NIS02548.1 ATPase [Gemmatimonadota bacterium]NIT68424.1 ATPase [Gemmatimonadota bacterium]NIU51876.1 ATPase [Gemmatimonadota bacterium]